MTLVTADAEQAKKTGGAILLWPHQDDAKDLAVAGGEPWEDLHITLYFFASDVTAHPSPIDLVRELDSELEIFPAIRAKLFAPALFNPEGDEPCAVMLAGDAPLLATLKNEVLAPLVAVHGPQDPDLYQQHEPWIPHVTIGYGMDFTQLPATRHLTFDRVTLEWADETYDFPLLD